MSKHRRRASFNQKNDESQKPRAERTEDLLKGLKANNIFDKESEPSLSKNEEGIETTEVENEEEKSILQELSEEDTNNLSYIKQQKLSLSLWEKDLEKRKSELDEKEQELLNAERMIRDKCAAAISMEISKIKEDEQNIRLQEKEKMYAEWENEKRKKSQELDTYIKKQRHKIDEEYLNAHLATIDVQNDRLGYMHKAYAAIANKQEEITKELKTRVDEYFKKRLEYEDKLQDLQEQQEEIDADTEYIRRLKEKYNKYSEKEVIKLEQRIEHYEILIEEYTARIKELTRKNARMQSHLLDEDGHSLIVKIEELETRLEEAVKRNDEFSNMPSKEEIEQLRENTNELSFVKLALDDERQKRNAAEAKVNAYAMSARELENARVSAAALESLNNQLQMKLKYISEQYKTAHESKFKVLLDIDRTINNKGIFNPKGYGHSLKELCDYVRNYGAYNKGLYYSIETIRVFFASLAASEKASRLLILQGLSGTGKSSLPRLVAEALDYECRIVPVQPSWRDNRELLGYDNDFTNRFKETEFTKFLYEASALPNRKKTYFIVLDEMNLARVEYYFADFLSILESTEKKDWIIPLVSGYIELDEDQKPKYLDYSNEAANICVTNNIWFIGTANNDDSTSLITDKVYDRAQVLDMEKREDRFAGKAQGKVSMDVEELLTLFQNAKLSNDVITDEDKNSILYIDEYLKEMDITFGNRIMSQMENFVPVYVACGGTKYEAIDYLLTHKILRKLDERYEPYLINKLEELESCLNEVFGEAKFKQSILKIHKLRDRISG